MTSADHPELRRRRPSAFGLLLVALCIALGATQVALVLRNRALSARVVELTQLVEAARPPELPPLEGRPFPALRLLDAEGAELDLTALPQGHATLLFVSSSACDYCDLARPVWDRVARSLAGSPVRVLELVLDAAPGELAQRDASHPLLAPPDPSLARQLPGVPAALVIDSAGVVRRSVYGGEQLGLERAVAELSAGEAGAGP